MDPLELERATGGNAHADRITSAGNAAVMYFGGQTRFFIPTKHYETIGAANVFDSAVEVFGPASTNPGFDYQFHRFGPSYQTELPPLGFGPDGSPLDEFDPDEKIPRLVELLNSHL